MAYMSQEKKKELAPKIKAVLKKYDVKGSISVQNHSTLTVTIAESKIDFGVTDYGCVNEYHFRTHFEQYPLAVQFLEELIQAMSEGNFDNSDIMTDYFHVGWYINIKIGSYNKHYKLLS